MNSSTKGHGRRFQIIVSTALAACLGSGAWLTTLAAEAPDTGKLEEIIVTAQKREQNLQEVGTSVTAFDSKSLETLGLKDVTDIANQVPGLQFNQYGTTVTIYNLRGVSQNDFSDHQEAPVAVYADDAYIGSTGALAGSLYDLERVEVLRGPQGTLFGRNATGGLIQYISRQPTDTYDGYVQVSGGNYSTLQTEGAISGPLTDTISARASFSTASHNGYISNRVGADLNNQKQYAGRLQFRFKLSDQGDVVVKLHELRNLDEVSGIYSWASSLPSAYGGRGVFTPGQPDPNGYNNPSTDPYQQSEDKPGRFDRAVWGGNVHVNWKFDGFSLTSVTDYLHMRKNYGEDSDMSPNTVFNYYTQANYQQWSEELRINGAEGPLRWIAGLYYLNYHTSNVEATVLPGSVPAPYGNGTAVLNLTTSSPAIFGQVEYDFTDRWTGILGARYTSDDKQYIYNYVCTTCAGPLPTDPPFQGYPQNVTYSVAAGYPDAKKNYSIPTGKAELQYKFSPEVMMYGSINHGAKGGGWSAPSSGFVNFNPSYQWTQIAPLLPMRYDDEKLTSYELGLKSTFWGGTARLNAAVFHYDYKNYQGFFLDVATQVVKNIDATVNGGELELAVVPVRGLNVQLGVSALDSKANNVPTNVPGIFITAELPQAPHWSVNAVVHYEWPAMNGKLSVEGDGKWDDRQYMELENAPVDLEPAYEVFNARAGYTSGDGRWDFFGYVRNLADKQYRVYNLDLSGFLGINQSVYATPRTYGATVTYRWGK